MYKPKDSYVLVFPLGCKGLFTWVQKYFHHCAKVDSPEWNDIIGIASHLSTFCCGGKRFLFLFEQVEVVFCGRVGDELVEMVKNHFLVTVIIKQQWGVCGVQQVVGMRTEPFLSNDAVFRVAFAAFDARLLCFALINLHGDGGGVNHKDQWRVKTTVVQLGYRSLRQLSGYEKMTVSDFCPIRTPTAIAIIYRQRYPSFRHRRQLSLYDKFLCFGLNGEKDNQ